MEHEGRDGDDRQHDPHLKGHAQHPADGDGLELRNLEHLKVAVGRHLGNAAAGNEENEGGDDRLDVELGDEPAVNRPNMPATRIGITMPSAMPT